jgi:hypothetical protein
MQDRAEERAGLRMRIGDDMGWQSRGYLEVVRATGVCVENGMERQ